MNVGRFMVNGPERSNDFTVGGGFNHGQLLSRRDLIRIESSTVEPHVVDKLGESSVYSSNAIPPDRADVAGYNLSNRLTSLFAIDIERRAAILGNDCDVMPLPVAQRCNVITAAMESTVLPDPQLLVVNKQGIGIRRTINVQTHPRHHILNIHRECVGTTGGNRIGGQNQVVIVADQSHHATPLGLAHDRGRVKRCERRQSTLICIQW